MVALGDVAAVLIFHKFASIVCNDVLVERVVLPQSSFPQVGVGFDASALAVGAVHEAQVVGPRRYTVPGLSSGLVVAHVLVAYLKPVGLPGDAAVVAARTACSAVHKAVGEGLIACAIDDEVVPQQAG